MFNTRLSFEFGLVCLSLIAHGHENRDVGRKRALKAAKRRACDCRFGYRSFYLSACRQAIC